MKKIILILCCLGLLLTGFFIKPKSFDAERILAQSSLKEKVFSGKTVQVTALDGKVSAYLMEEHSVPIVSMAFGFDRAGKAYEDKIGVALMAENSLLDGAGKYSRQALREVMKEKGIKLTVALDEDRISFMFSYVKNFESDAVEVLKAVLYQPLLAEDNLDLTRRQLQAVRRQQKENPSYYLRRLVDDNFYKAHPYGKENIPDENALQAVKADDIRAYMQTFMGKNNLKIGVSGDVTVAETEKLLADIFANLTDSAVMSELPSFEPDFQEEKAAETLNSSAQSFMLLFAKGIKRLDEDFYPLYIADYIFGGSGLNSRLNKAVREAHGLTYGIYSYFTNSDAVDLWHIYFSATPDNAEQAVDIVRQEYQKFYDEGVSAEELQRAKQSLLSSFNLRFSSLTNIAEMLELMQVENLGIDFLLKRQSLVEQVTLEQVNTAILKHLPKTLDKDGGVRFFEIKGEKK